MALLLTTILCRQTARAGQLATSSEASLRTSTGEYLSAYDAGDGDAPIFADAVAIGASETFHLRTANPVANEPSCFKNGVRVHVSTPDGRYWIARDGQVLASAPTPGDPMSTFALINETDPNRCIQYGDAVSIVAGDRNYLSASPGGVLDADQSEPGDWERFWLVDPVFPNIYEDLVE